MSHPLLRPDPMLHDEPRASVAVVLAVLLLVSMVLNVVLAVRCREYLQVIDSRQTEGTQ
jgi:hypothetical protein